MNHNEQHKLRQKQRRQRLAGAAVSFALLLLFCGIDAFECSSRPISSVLARRQSAYTSASINGYPRHQLALAKKDDTTSEEEHRKKGRNGFAVQAQQMVDRGEADTLKEAHSLIATRGSRAAAQNLVNSGEAATLAEAYSLLATRRSRAAAQMLVDNGEAATIQEANQLWAARAREAFEDKYTEKEIAVLSKKAGVIGAIKQGKYTKYAGVSFHEPTGKWMVRVYNRGKRIYVGLYVSELQGAKAHDEYVRKHGLKRPLHFPREGEVFIESSTIQPRSAGEKNK